MSRSEARRNIAQGGVRLDGEPVTELDFPADELDGRVLQVGKRRFLRLAPADGVHSALLRLQTAGEGEIVDLTAGLAGALRSAGVADGVVTVFVTGSTAAITTMEYEPGGVQDLQEAIERLVPRRRPEGGDYAHNRLNHDDNAHAHLRASLLGPSRASRRALQARAGHLAAGRADRLRRPAAGARRSTSRSWPEAC